MYWPPDVIPKVQRAEQIATHSAEIKMSLELCNLKKIASSPDRHVFGTWEEAELP